MVFISGGNRYSTLHNKRFIAWMTEEVIIYKQIMNRNITVSLTQKTYPEVNLNAFPVLVPPYGNRTRSTALTTLAFEL